MTERGKQKGSIHLNGGLVMEKVMILMVSLVFLFSVAIAPVWADNGGGQVQGDKSAQGDVQGDLGNNEDAPGDDAMGNQA